MKKCSITINGTRKSIGLDRFKPYMRKPIRIRALRIFEPFAVKTLEGIEHGKAGDFLIIGAEGEKYVCDQNIFFKIHARVRSKAEKRATRA
jgi:hypothetical protein